MKGVTGQAVTAEFGIYGRARVLSGVFHILQRTNAPCALHPSKIRRTLSLGAEGMLFSGVYVEPGCHRATGHEAAIPVD